MGDIRFKISGNTEPFSVKLWDSSCSTIIQEKVVEYPDTCVILGRLEPVTTYHLDITDKIGYSISSGYTTPTALTPPLPPEIDFSVGGTVYSPNEYSAYLTGDKRLIIDPPLQINEMVDLTFNIFTCNNSSADNSVQLYRNNTSTPIKTFLDNGSESYTINNVTSSDYICYTLSSICHNGATGDIVGCSTLNLTGVNSVGSASISANIGSPSTQKVAISATDNVFTLDPMSFSFNQIDFGDTMEIESTKSWYVQTPYVDWITINPSHGTGDLTINVTPQKNLGIVRNTQINFIQNETGDVATVSINQAGAPAAITVDPPSILFSTGELVKSVLVGSSPYGWEIVDMVNDKPSWVNSISPSSAIDGDTNVEINVDSLIKPITRSGTIKFTQVDGDNITTTLNVTQSNVITPTLPPLSVDDITVSPSKTDPILAWNDVTYMDSTITSSSNWEVIDDYPSWVTSVTSSGSSGMKPSVNLDFFETGTLTPRKAVITFRLISNPTITDTLEIIQSKM